MNAQKNHEEIKAAMEMNRRHCLAGGVAVATAIALPNPPSAQNSARMLSP